MLHKCDAVVGARLQISLPYKSETEILILSCIEGYECPGISGFLCVHI